MSSNHPKPDSKKICVGIDLGTSSSCCSFIDPTTSQLFVLSQGTNKSTIPSVVHYSQTTPEILVGEQALQRGPSFPKDTIFGAKRLIGLTEASLENKRYLKELSYGPFDLGINSTGEVGFQITYNNTKTTVTPTDIATRILQYFKDQVLSQTGYIIDEVVLTVPAYFTPDQRSATARAAHNAGLTLLRLIPEPTAAAFAYVSASRQTMSLSQAHLKDNEPDYILVYDFGGGTLDTSLVRQTYLPNKESQLEVLATAGDPLLGGADLDNDLIKWCVKQLSTRFNVDPAIFFDDPNKTRRLRQVCKAAKESLSTSISVEIDLDDFYQREQFSVKLTRTLFQTICKETLKRAFNPIKQVLQDTGIDKAKVKDVVLVGGSSRIPLIQDQLKKIFNFNDVSQLARTVNPDECVAKGAALFAATLTSHPKQKLEAEFTNCVNSFPLTLYYSYSPNHKAFTSLIPINSPLPIKGSRDLELDRAVLRNLDPAVLRLALFQVPISKELAESRNNIPQIEEQFKLLKNRMFKRYTLPVNAVSNFGDISPYVITIHYQIDENGVMDVFFHDQELNTIIDVNLNNATTESIVKETLDNQHKSDVLERYNHAQQQQQQQQQQQRLPIPPKPSQQLRAATTTASVVPVAPVAPIAPTEKEQSYPHHHLPPPPKQPLPDSPPHQTPTQSNDTTQPPQQQQPPPQIPQNLNQNFVNQLKDLVQVRDEMIMSLQQQILSLKRDLDKRNSDCEYLNNAFNNYKTATDHELIDLQTTVIELSDENEVLKKNKSQGGIENDHDRKGEEQNETKSAQSQQTQIDIDTRISEATQYLTDQYNVLNEQYSSLYEHYDALHAENEGFKNQLEKTNLEMRALNSKNEHMSGLIKQNENTQALLQDKIDELDRNLQERDDRIEKMSKEVEAKTIPTPTVSQPTPENGPPQELPSIPPPVKCQSSVSVVFSPSEQDQMILSSLPPLPPIASNIFSGQSQQPQQRPHLPPPPLQPKLRSVTKPTDAKSPTATATTSTSPSQLPHTPINDTHTASSTAPIAPPAPPIIPPGSSSKSFLLDILNKPTLRKVTPNDTTADSNEKNASNNDNNTGNINNKQIAPGPPRLTLLSQIHVGQKMLKSVEKPEDDGPKSTNPLLGNELMEKIAMYRSKVADDEPEEDFNDEDW
jgi:molecular chaperone DnaK (HSP70)